MCARATSVAPHFISFAGGEFVEKDAATHCTALHHTARHCTALHRAAPHCNTLRRTATNCTTLHRTHCTVLHSAALQHTAPSCNSISVALHFSPFAGDEFAERARRCSHSRSRIPPFCPLVRIFCFGLCVFVCVCAYDCWCVCVCCHSFLF